MRIHSPVNPFFWPMVTPKFDLFIENANILHERFILANELLISDYLF